MHAVMINDTINDNFTLPQDCGEGVPVAARLLSTSCLILIKLAIAVCLFSLSFCIGYCAMEAHATTTVSATVESYDIDSGTLLLLDCNSDEWIFCNVSPSQFINDTYNITYKGNFELLKVTNNNGQSVDFI